MNSDLAVIGAGPGGLAAAMTAAKAGLKVVVLDENIHPGGQYLRGARKNDNTAWRSKAEKNAREFLARIQSPGIEIKSQCLVWDLDGKRLALHGPQGIEYLQAEAIIIATGGRELVPPFPGWTLPGVMTLGAAKFLAKEHGQLPGKRILIAGSGPLLLAAASTLLAAMSQNSRDKILFGILEATSPLDWLPHTPAILGNWDRLQEGRQYLGKILQAKIPYRFNRTIIKVEGTDQLTTVTSTRLDRHGQAIHSSLETHEVDTLCLGFGFVPNIELTQLAGCSHHYRQHKGGWVPVVNQEMQTSVPEIFAVGETAGIAGAGAAMIEGQIAALSAATELGCLDQRQAHNRKRQLNRQLRAHTRFSKVLNTLFGPPNMRALVDEQTTICRCEEIRFHEVQAAIQAGASSLSDLKNWLQVGQGNCQGRTCGPILAQLLASQANISPTDTGLFRPRPPLKPIPLSDLAQGDRP